MGIAEQTAVVHDDDEPEDGAVPVCTEDNAKNRYVPSRAALPIIRPSLGRQQTIAEKANIAMQGYLNQFLGNMEIVNSREQNTKIYHDVFSCIPNDSIHSRSALRQRVSHWKEKLGLTTTDLGVAPERLEISENEETKVKLKSTKGILVSFPFMCHEASVP